MKIYLTSANREAGGNREQERTLFRLWELSSRRHEIVNSAAESDYALVGNISGRDWFLDLRNHSEINRYPIKCFAISDSDIPMPLLRGIYTSAHQQLRFKSRFRSGAYHLFPVEFQNPLVNAYAEKAFEKAKSYLFSFQGRDSSEGRKALFRLKPTRADILIENTTSSFNAFVPDHGAKLAGQKQYLETLERSKFAICPRGVSAASIRLFEAMSMGVAPVILSDDWIFPKGPDWNKCAVIIPEKSVMELEAILERRESEYREIGQQAYAAYQRFFSERSYFDYLVDQMIDIDRHQRIPETLFWRFRNEVVQWWKAKKQIQHRFGRT